MSCSCVLVYDSKIDLRPLSLIQSFQSIISNDPVCYLVHRRASLFGLQFLQNPFRKIATVAFNIMNQHQPFLCSC